MISFRENEATATKLPITDLVISENRIKDILLNWFSSGSTNNCSTICTITVLYQCEEEENYDHNLEFWKS